MEKGDPILALFNKTISVQNDALHEKSTEGMFSPQEPEPPLIRTCIQQRQEISHPPDETSQLFSDIATFLGTHSSPLAAIETPLIPGSAPQSQFGPNRVSGQPICILIAYHPKDQEHKDHIERDLKTLLRRHSIKWDAYDVTTSPIWITDVDDPPDAYNLVLPLMSPEFVSSDFCDDSSLSPLIGRHMMKGAFWVCPVLLRPCLWEETLLVQLPILPKSRVPVSKWSDKDDAFFDIAKDIKGIFDRLKGRG